MVVLGQSRSAHVFSRVTYVLGFCIGASTSFETRVWGNTNFSIFRYQHVGIPNAKFSLGGLSQCTEPTQMFLRRSGI